MDFSVHLINLDAQGNQLTGPDRDPDAIRTTLQRLFDYTLRRARALRLSTEVVRISVGWPALNQNFRPRPIDIVVYVVPTTTHSVVAAIGGTAGPDPNEAGWTKFVDQPMGLTGAEIYSSPALPNATSRSPSPPRWRTPEIAAIAFHECMHYKMHDKRPNFPASPTHRSPGLLHDIEGGLLARISPPGGRDPSDGDVRAFVPTFSNLWTPFTGGATRYQQNLRSMQATRGDRRLEGL